MRNFRIQDRAAPNLSCATGLSVESILRDLSKTFFSNLLGRVLIKSLLVTASRLIGPAVFGLDLANSDHVVRIPNFAAFLLRDEMLRVSGKGSD